MSVNTHLDVLATKHVQLENEINSAYRNHLPDNLITELKKQKLLLKQELLNLQKKYQIEEVAA